jgi:hypothetical protein
MEGLMRNVEVTRISPNGLERIYWNFFYRDSYHELVLNRYDKSYRQTKRHGFKTVEFYCFGDRRQGLKSVEIPIDVQEDAAKLFWDGLKFKVHDNAGQI